MRIRLDRWLVEAKLASTRSKAQEMIAQGMVSVDGGVMAKANFLVGPESKVIICGPPLGVSRAGRKLAAALDFFRFDPKKLIALDVGASTGGFTQTLLERGAHKVFAVDVGTQQLDPILLKDARVVSIEQQDIRSLECLPYGVRADFAVVDVSFISLSLVLPHLKRFLCPSASIIALFKPQFEVGPKFLNKKGVVKDLKAQGQALHSFEEFCGQQGFKILGQMPSPIEGKSGNKEFLFYLSF